MTAAKAADIVCGVNGCVERHHDYYGERRERERDYYGDRHRDEDYRRHRDYDDRYERHYPPIQTIDDVKRGADEGQKALGDVGRQIGAKLGLTFKDPGPKTKTESGVQRVMDKAALREGGLAA